MSKVYVKDYVKTNADGDKIQVVKVYPSKVKGFKYVIFR